MQNFLTALGKFFNGLSLFLTIVHHIIWIIIGGAILIAVYALISAGGPGKIIQDAIPQQLSQQLNGQSSQTTQLSQAPQINQQEIQCVATILGQTRASQLQNGSSPTSQEQTKILGCFPKGFQF